MSKNAHLALELVQVFNGLDAIIVAVIHRLRDLHSVPPTMSRRTHAGHTKPLPTQSLSAERPGTLVQWRPRRLACREQGPGRGARCHACLHSGGSHLLVGEALHLDPERAVGPAPSTRCGHAGHPCCAERPACCRLRDDSVSFSVRVRKAAACFWHVQYCMYAVSSFPFHFRHFRERAGTLKACHGWKEGFRSGCIPALIAEQPSRRFEHPDASDRGDRAGRERD